jgi:hypothetical protein
VAPFTQADVIDVIDDIVLLVVNDVLLLAF